MSSPDHERARSLATPEEHEEVRTLAEQIVAGSQCDRRLHKFARAYLARDAEVQRLREALARVPDVAYEVATNLGHYREEALEIAAGILCAALAESTEANEEYLILDTRSTVGNCALWWGPDRSGYVCSIDEAGRYTKAEAERQAASRSTDVAVPLARAEQLAIRHVRRDSLDREQALRGGAMALEWHPGTDKAGDPLGYVKGHVSHAEALAAMERWEGVWWDVDDEPRFFHGWLRSAPAKAEDRCEWETQWIGRGGPERGAWAVTIYLNDQAKWHPAWTEVPAELEQGTHDDDDDD